MGVPCEIEEGGDGRDARLRQRPRIVQQPGHVRGRQARRAGLFGRVGGRGRQARPQFRRVADAEGAQLARVQLGPVALLPQGPVL